MTKEARIYNGEKTVSSISGAGKTGQLHVKELNQNILLTPYMKINSKWIKELNVTLDTIKLLEKNIGRTLFDINCSNIFFDPPPRVIKIKTKINKWDPVKLKSFCTTKETINKTKRKPTEWKKIFANKATNRRLSSKIYKELIQLCQKNKQGIPWWSRGQDSTLSLPRAQVQSLISELRSCKLHGMRKNKK